MTDRNNARNVRPSAAPALCELTEELVTRLRESDAAGLKEYGDTVDRTDLTAGEWAAHALAEMLDSAKYMEAMRRQAEAVMAAVLEYVEAREAYQAAMCSASRYGYPKRVPHDSVIAVRFQEAYRTLKAIAERPARAATILEEARADATGPQLAALLAGTWFTEPQACHLVLRFDTAQELRAAAAELAELRAAAGKAGGA